MCDVCVVEEKVLHFEKYDFFFLWWVMVDASKMVAMKSENPTRRHKPNRKLWTTELFLENSMKNFLSNFLDTLPLMYIMYMYVVVM